MRPVFDIDGVDFSWILSEESIQVSRNDIDTQGTTRSKVTGTMYRKRLTTKRKLNISKCRNMTTAQIASLTKALDKDTVEIRYLDFSGEIRQSRFYGSTVDATTQIYDSSSDETYWTNTTFNLIEV